MKASSLWLACVALTCVACAGGPGWLTRNPAVETLLAESRAALVEMDWERAQELADKATELYPNSAPARTWAGLLHEGDTPWMPPGLRQPLPAPGPHVVPGALLFVSVPALPLAASPIAGEEATDSLPLGAAVSVLGVEGGLAHVRQVGVNSLLQPGAPPQWSAAPLPSGVEEREGYVAARFLEAAPVDLSALRQRVRTLLASGSREEALQGMELLLFAEPWDTELPGELHRLALELERIPAAVRAARTASEEAPPPEAPSLEVSLLYGCRGNVLTAEVHAEAQAEAGTAEACVMEVDITPPRGVVSIADCSFANPQDEEGRAWRARVVAEAFERMERDQERYDTESKAYAERLDRLRELYPQGPFLCVTVIQTGERARWNLPVQLYSMPAGGTECSTAEEVPDTEASPLVEKLQLDELRVPYLMPGDAVVVCRKEAHYEELFYGAVLAPDAQTAADFVRRREKAQWAMENERWSEEKQQQEQTLQEISGELPHVRLDTASPPDCNLYCY